MKIQHLIPILFLAAFCTVSAQTNTPTTPALLTTNQAETLALQLTEGTTCSSGSNVFVYTTWHTNTLVFPPYIPPMVTGNTRYSDGHWIIPIFYICSGQTNELKVEIAADGSTNSVSIANHKQFW